jgi:DNA-binding MarR family transcriptional regulator
MDNNHIAFVISDVARLYRRRFDERTRSFRITGPQMRALVAIMRFPGINQGSLADRLDVEPITTCRMVDRLEQAGLVERRRDPQDRRAWQLFLTDAAEPITTELQSIGESVLADSLRGIDPAARDAAIAVLGRIRDNLGSITQGNDDGPSQRPSQGAIRHG